MRTLITALFTLTLVGCGTESKTTVNIPAETTTPVVFNAAGAPTVEIEIPSMDCKMCAGAYFADIEGVEDCQFDEATKVATLAIDEESFDTDEVMTKLQAEYADAKLAAAAE